MDSKKLSEKQISVGGSSDVVPIEIRYIDSDYNLKIYPNKKAPPTGLVTFAELESSDNQLPKFIFRWDRVACTMDIDINLNGILRKDLWGQQEYYGHHPEIHNIELREYNVLIGKQGRKIFEGIIRISLLVNLNLHEEIKVSENINIKIT